jgi:hypothetical protein
MAKRRSAEEIEQLLDQYRASGLTQIEYCRQAGVALSTLSRHLRRHGGACQRLIQVRVGAAPEPDPGFVLVLGNGRRIEAGWRFGDAELARLIRIAEAV